LASPSFVFCRKNNFTRFCLPINQLITNCHVASLWIQFFFGMALMILFTAIPLWIGFGSGEHEFNTSTTIGPITKSSSGSDGMGRFVFGGSGVLMIFITIAMAISQLKNIFKIK
jgi:hypothetical protein